MKTLIITIFLTLNLVCLSQENSNFSDKELEMVNEINNLRDNPSSFIPYIETYIEMCSKLLKDVNSGKLNTTRDYNNTILTAKELIKELEKSPKLNKLIPNNEMYLVSKEHGNYLKTINNISHYGNNNETLNERMKRNNINFNNYSENIINNNGRIISAILVLLIDDLYEDRGHRKNLLNPNSKFISVYNNGDLWIQNFSN